MSQLSSGAEISVQGHMMNISDDEFDAIRKLIYGRFGINLTEQKRSLLVGRLQKLVRNHGFLTFQQYYQHLIDDKSERSLSELVDRISTNHTYFNRENDHFGFFRDKALPDVIQRLKKKQNYDLRIWCAGCSSGEEAYMLLMLMHEVLGRDYGKWNGGILATDISDRVLGVARRGIYSEQKLGNMPDALKCKYFKRRNDGNWEIESSLRNEVTFRRFNLMNDGFPFKKQFQIIFCRNVMIYFDQQTRNTLVDKFHRLTEPEGYLFIGHSETLGRNQGLYKYLLPAAYQKVEA